ncbi:MAG: hypothetical protein ACO3LE_08145, partial [Bdellovibrionota bacterium]
CFDKAWRHLSLNRPERSHALRHSIKTLRKDTQKFHISSSLSLCLFQKLSALDAQVNFGHCESRLRISRKI